MKAVDPGAAVALTVTWPPAFPKDPREWTRARDLFRKRMVRRWGKVPGVWRLEFQRRRAPHLHILLLDVEDLDGFRAWCISEWADISGGKLDQAGRGVDVDPVRHWERWTSYMGKAPEVMAPTCADPETGEVLPVGRLWNVWGKLPVDRRMVELTPAAVFRIRRAVWRYLGWRSRSRRAGLSAMVPPAVSGRLIEWAQGLDGTPSPS